MKREEQLLIILMEECAELAQRASKALRFGLDEIEPGQELSNSERLDLEFNDLVSVAAMLRNEKQVFKKYNWDLRDAKVQKVEKYLDYSRQLGILDVE